MSGFPYLQISRLALLLLSTPLCTIAYANDNPPTATSNCEVPLTPALPPHPVIDPQADAYRKRDLETFAAFYSDDVKGFRNGEVFFSGIEDLKMTYKSIFNSSPNLTLEISARRIEGSYVYDTEHITGLRGNPDKIVASVRYKVEGEKITEVLITR